ncbi:hypothetical protein MICRO11B_100022 [Micrococcus luteus]|nr:hypothetical protein MICRO11B_100022 [Micrococcus luteus]
MREVNRISNHHGPVRNVILNRFRDGDVSIGSEYGDLLEWYDAMDGRNARVDPGAAECLSRRPMIHQGNIIILLRTECGKFQRCAL